jgi:hypothetical protein
MIKVIAKIDFEANGIKYIKGDELDIKDINSIIKLNERGFIEPLSYRDLVIIERELNKKKEEI